jgi:hypothetical protein
MGIEEMAVNSIKTNQFIILDRIFWIIWLAFPVTIWLTYGAVMAESPLLADIPEVCRASIPLVSQFSTVGKFAVASYFLWPFLLYGFLFWLAHRTIRRCMRGDVLVDDILRTLGVIGAVVASWAFIDLVVSNVVNYIIKLTGDVKIFAPEYAFDVGLPALGILILAMRAVIAYAIEVKQDQDLTI